MGKGGGKGKGNGKNNGAPFMVKKVRFDTSRDIRATAGFVASTKADVAANCAGDHSVGNDVWDCLRVADFAGEHELVRWKRGLAWQDAVISACTSVDCESSPHAQNSMPSQDITDVFMAADFVGDHDRVDELQSLVDWEMANAHVMYDVPDDIACELRAADFVGEQYSVRWEPSLPIFYNRTAPQVASPRSHIDEAFIVGGWAGNHDCVEW
jgi:hypothetical protein